MHLAKSARTTLGILMTGCLFSYAAMAQTEDGLPTSGSVSIQSFRSTGSGCPPGTVAANLSPDNKALTFMFDAYVLETNGVSQTVQKNCVLDLALKAPTGWRYALFSIDYRGFADLSAGVSAAQQTEYAFGISGQRRIGSMDLSGPTTIDYFHRSIGTLSELAWSDCGNSGGPDVLTITTNASLTSRPEPSVQEVRLSSVGGKYAETFVNNPIVAMKVVKKESALACTLGQSFGFSGKKAWVERGCRAVFSIETQNSHNNPGGQGLLSVDSIDAQILEPGQVYGVAWQRCGEGRWVQSNGNKDCNQVCNDQGMKLGSDPFGAMCASGETRPNSAAGAINFNQGCWGGSGCQGIGNIKSESHGLFCYQPGQRKDADKTDRSVGCYCKR